MLKIVLGEKWGVPRQVICTLAHDISDKIVSIWRGNFGLLSVETSGAQLLKHPLR
jgi:hypothetical protein